jgi:hypothetical protein
MRAGKAKPVARMADDQEQHDSNSRQEMEYQRIISYN